MKGPVISALVFAGLMALAVPLRAAEPAHLIILPFDNVTGRKAQDPLQEGIADLLTACFAQLAEQVVVVDRSVLQELTEEQSLSHENLVAEGTWQRAGRLSGASHLLRGNFRQNPNGLNVLGLLYDLGSTQLLFSAEFSGGSDELANILCDGIAPAVAAQLSNETLPNSPLTLDLDPAYNQLMIVGMGHYYNGNIAAAFPAFLKILREHPEDEPAQFWLAKSFYEGGMKEFAAIEFKKYLTLHSDNKRRAEVEALLHEIESDGHE